jgi:Cu+-exporting ATPase
MSEQETKHRHETSGKSCCGGGGGTSAAGGLDTLVADPVCGMKIDPATSKHRHDHDGVT